MLNKWMLHIAWIWVLGFLNKLSMVTARILHTLALGFENSCIGENKLIVIALQS